jgi:hypothetical protein
MYTLNITQNASERYIKSYCSRLIKFKISLLIQANPFFYYRGRVNRSRNIKGQVTNRTGQPERGGHYNAWANSAMASQRTSPCELSLSLALTSLLKFRCRRGRGEKWICNSLIRQTESGPEERRRQTRELAKTKFCLWAGLDAWMLCKNVVQYLWRLL